MQIPAGTTIIFKGGSFSGVLPSTCEFSDGAAVTSTGTDCAVTFQAGYVMPSGSSLTLTGGSLSASTFTINGTLSLTNVSTEITTSATVGGSLAFAGNALDLAVPTLVKTSGGSVVVSCKNASGTSWEVDSLTTAEDAAITTLEASGAVVVGGDASGTTWTTGNLTVGGLFSVGSLVLNGSSTVPLTSVTSLTLGASGALTLAANSSLTTLATSAGAAISFPTTGEVRLAVTSSASISGTTTLSGKGYLAAPSDTSFSNFTQATGADVRLCQYGAGVTRLDGTVDALGTTATVAITKTDSSKTVLTEVLDGESWTLLTAQESSSTFTATTRGTTTYLRVFDGAAFVTTSVYAPAPHIWLEYESVYDAVLATANPYETAVQIASTYLTETDFIMASEYAYAGESILLMGRVKFSGTSTLMTSSDLGSIKYTCYKVKDAWGSKSKTAVTGHSAVTIPNNSLLSSLVTTDSRWTKDSTGYNFLYEPDTTTNPIFPEAGNYEIVVTLTPTTGNPAPLVFEVEVN